MSGWDDAFDHYLDFTALDACFEPPVSLCNFCTLQDIRARAAHEGKWVTISHGSVISPNFSETWVEVHVHEYNQTLSRDTWRCSFMALTEECAC